MRPGERERRGLPEGSATKSVARNLRSLRKRAGITQKELGDRCGIPNSTISYIETGSMYPSTPMIDALASGLGVSPVELLQDPSDGPDMPAVPLHIRARHPNGRAYVVSDDGLAPVIAPRSLVFVVPDPPPRPCAAALLRIGGALVLRELVSLPGELVIRKTLGHAVSMSREAFADRCEWVGEVVWDCPLDEREYLRS